MRRVDRTDRRRARTKRILNAALQQLLSRRSYQRITVEDITRQADIGRSTFYLHYKSKEDLMFSGFEHALKALATQRPGANHREGLQFSLPLLKHIGGERRFALSLLAGDNSSAMILRRTFKILTEIVQLELKRMPTGRLQHSPSDANSSYEAEACGIVGAFLGVLGWWLWSGSDATPESVDKLFQQIVGKSR